jgi:hypothetical protein
VFAALNSPVVRAAVDDLIGQDAWVRLVAASAFRRCGLIAPGSGPARLARGSPVLSL